MKKRNLFFLSIIVVVMATSCSSVKTSTAKQMEADGQLRQTTTLVDLTISPNKVAAAINVSTAEARTLNVAALKDKAIAQALREVGGDVLVEPRFEIETNGFKFAKRITRISVSGYPATYSKFRTISESDKELIKQEFILNMRPDAAVKCSRSMITPMGAGLGVFQAFGL